MAKKTKRASSQKNDSSDWISALAKEASASSSKSGDAENKVLSKQERIERRNAKKLRRQERKGSSSAAETMSRSAQHKQQGHERSAADTEALRIKAHFYLGELSRTVQDNVKRINEGKSYNEIKYAKAFAPSEGRGKATRHQQLSDDGIQVCTVFAPF